MIQRGDVLDEVTDKAIEAVVVGGVPIAVAVAAGVEQHRGVAACGKAARGALPRVARLAAAVQQQHDVAWVAAVPPLAGQAHAQSIEVKELGGRGHACQATYPTDGNEGRSAPDRGKRTHRQTCRKSVYATPGPVCALHIGGRMMASMDVIGPPLIESSAPPKPRELQRPGLGQQLKARLERARLDRDLAAGCSPQRSRLHALRARQLAGPFVRSEVARSLRHVVDAAMRPDAVLTPVRLRRSTVLVSLRQEEVQAWREGLLGLAARIDGHAAGNPCGGARGMSLLADGAGPLYNPDPQRGLAETIWWIADGLALRPA